MKVATRINLKRSHSHKEKIIITFMVMDGTRFIVVIIFAAYTNIESLYCASETNMFIILQLSIF